MDKTDKELFRIKPLEWKWFDDTLDGVLKARGFKARFGTCFVGLVFQEERPNPEKWSVWHWMPKEGGTHICASPEEGKQLAEQHWREYIKQALVEVQP